MALWPRPSSCGKMNHIQWLRLRPAPNSSVTLTSTGVCASTKRVRSGSVISIPPCQPQSDAVFRAYGEAADGFGGEARDRIETEAQHQARQDHGSLLQREGSAKADPRTLAEGHIALALG